MLAIINIIIVIITCKSRARTWSWLQDDLFQIWVEANNTWCKAFLHASRLSCSKPFFSIRPHIISPSPPTKLSHNRHLGKALATWLNNNHWIKRLISPEKILTLNRISWSNFSPFLNSIPYFFLNASKLQLRNAHLQQQKVFLIFYFYCVRFSCYIFRDSTNNLDYGM